MRGIFSDADSDPVDSCVHVQPVSTDVMKRTVCVWCIPVILAPTTVGAHEGQPLAPHDLWSAWSLEPWVVILLALSGSAFVIGTARLRRRAGRWPAGIALSAASFMAGWLVLAIS